MRGSGRLCCFSRLAGGGVQAFAGLGLKNTLELNLGLFSGIFEIDIDNWAAARCYLFGFKFDFLDIKVRQRCAAACTE